MTDDLERTAIVEIDEPATNGAPAGPVTPPSQAPRGGNYRWVIAGGVILLVVALTALAFTLFTGRAPRATVLAYVPADSLMYGEARLDLPGDQRMALGQFLSRFPGFADQSILESKLDETLDRIIGDATDGEASFTADIKPWFDGEFAFSLGALPDPASASSAGVPEDARFLVLLSVKDEALARTWVDAALTEAGATVTHETYNGADLAVASGREDGRAAAAVLDARVLVIGDPTSVRAAVDTGGQSPFADSPEFDAALDATSGDHVGFMYVAVGAMVDWASRLESGSTGLGVDPATLEGIVPDWAAFAVRVEADGLVMESFLPRPDEVPAQASRESRIAGLVPSSTIALTVSHDYGAGLLDSIDRFGTDPELAPTLEGLEEALGALGGKDAALGWIGDLGVVVNRSGDGVDGGLVIVPTDATAARNVFTSVRTLASMGGSMMGISIRDEDHQGTTMTVVDLGAASDLAGLAGLAGVPPEIVGEVDPVGGERVELAYALLDDLVVVGASPSFVRAVLDTTAEISLASTERYRRLVDRVGQGTGGVFADVTAIRELLETAMQGSPGLPAYEQDVKPFLVPFDALIGAGSTRDDILRNKVILTVK